MKLDDRREVLACPRCGSELFVSARSGERLVFQMDSDHSPVLVQPEQQSADAAPINPQVLYCGACSWHGSADALVASRM